MTPYLMPRERWSAVLEGRGCQFVEDVHGLDSPTELWKSPDDKKFLVPYFVDEEVDRMERRVADFSLKNIVASLEADPMV